MDNIGRVIDSILNRPHLNLLKSVFPVRLPYPSIGGTPCANINSFEVVDNNTVYLTLNHKIYNSDSDLFRKTIALSSKADSFVYFLMRNNHKDLIHELSDRKPAFDNKENIKPVNSKELLEVLKNKNIEHIFVRQDDSLIPITNISLGIDWDNHKLFFGSNLSYTCSNDILNQHIEILTNFIDKATKIKSKFKPSI